MQSVGVGRIAVTVTALGLVIAAGACQREAGRLLGLEEVEAEALRAELAGGAPPFIVDVRKPADFAGGHIAGALSFGLEELPGFLARAGIPKDRPLVTVCYQGRLSRLAATMAASNGHSRVRSLKGGMARWQQLGYPVAAGDVLAP